MYAKKEPRSQEMSETAKLTPAERHPVRAMRVVAWSLLLALSAPSLALAKASEPNAKAADGSLDQFATTALTHTRGLVAAYNACSDVAPDVACPALDGLFDFEALTRAPLAGHADKLNGKQRERFYRAFGKVVRSAARQSGRDLAKGDPEVRYVGRVPQGAKSEVHIARPEDDVDLRVAFIWRAGAKSWQVVDVELDGASMVQDYHNQFGRVLKKDGAEALVRKVETRSQKSTQDGTKADATDAP